VDTLKAILDGGGCLQDRLVCWKLERVVSQMTLE